MPAEDAQFALATSQREAAAESMEASWAGLMLMQAQAPCLAAICSRWVSARSNPRPSTMVVTPARSANSAAHSLAALSSSRTSVEGMPTKNERSSMVSGASGGLAPKDQMLGQVFSPTHIN